jgi:hypothetical protein
VTAVKNVFLNAPSSPGGPGPITLHVLIDEQITYKGSSHQNNLAFVPCTGPAGASDGDFDGIKALHFGTATERAAANRLNAKALAFRYALFAHNLLGLGSTSGCAEIGGNDLVVAMGSFTSVNGHNVGSEDEVQSTVLHEFGHTVGLRHGGGDNVNCKPNQVSVMNYTNQFSKPLNKVGQRPLDYSRGQFGEPVVLLDGPAVGLDKNSLKESTGIGPSYTGPIAYGPVPTFGTTAVVAAGGPVDWNKDGDTADNTLALDVDQTTNTAGGCPPSQLGSPNNPTGRYLVSFNEWALVDLNFRSSVDFADGGHVTAGETTLVLDPNTGLPVPAGTPGITLDEVFAFNVGATNDKIAIVPHRININMNWFLGVVIFGRPDAPGQPGTGLDAATIDPASLRLASLDGGTWMLRPEQTSSGRFDCVIFDV